MDPQSVVRSASASLDTVSDDKSQIEFIEQNIPPIFSIPEAVKYVQLKKLIPAVPKFMTEGLTTANLVHFHQWMQTGVLSSFNIEVIQGLVQAEYDPDTGGVVLRITQLIAGFLIGPRGLSIRDLAQGTGCVIKSWIEDSSIECPRDTRVFVLEGAPSCVLTCLDVVIAAIDRYRDLAEGKWRGQYVNKTQMIKGFVFVYYPPPKDRVPMAAGIKGFPTSSKQAMAARSLLGLNPKSVTQGMNAGAILAQASTSVVAQTPVEEIDDLKATYPGIFPGRVYNPKTATRGTVQLNGSMPTKDMGFSLAGKFCRSKEYNTMGTYISGVYGGENPALFGHSGQGLFREESLGCGLYNQVSPCVQGMYGNETLGAYDRTIQGLLKEGQRYPCAGFAPQGELVQSTNTINLYDRQPSLNPPLSTPYPEARAYDSIVSENAYLPQYANNFSFQDIYQYLQDVIQSDDESTRSLKASIEALTTGTIKTVL
eukprot:TRINITY_DN1790_c0_g1_i6.p1 TRINITY_DN1790_c0_g1~~TRINITY_DN1790_c0_g1_i6.p1  ORF type:complete len:482 (+),score=53.08 TRINITY_DN1790_c0_g1_i6:429-1874(+)